VLLSRRRVELGVREVSVRLVPLAAFAERAVERFPAEEPQAQDAGALGVGDVLACRAAACVLLEDRLRSSGGHGRSVRSAWKNGVCSPTRALPWAHGRPFRLRHRRMPALVRPDLSVVITHLLARGRWSSAQLLGDNVIDELCRARA
jgi:hypothetical protein